MAYIIGAYNKWDSFDRAHSVYKFKINENWYAVKEIEMKWGLPQLPMRMEEQMPESYYIYEQLEDAIEFARKIRSLN